VFGIIVKKETIIGISIYNRGRAYCNNNMLYTGSLDETNFDRYMLVVEPDYLPDSEVLAFSRVYTP
jgi:hypothetical protein